MGNYPLLGRDSSEPAFSFFFERKERSYGGTAILSLKNKTQLTNTKKLKPTSISSRMPWLCTWPWTLCENEIQAFQLRCLNCSLTWVSKLFPLCQGSLWSIALHVKHQHRILAHSLNYNSHPAFTQGLVPNSKAVNVVNCSYGCKYPFLVARKWKAKWQLSFDEWIRKHGPGHPCLIKINMLHKG